MSAAHERGRLTGTKRPCKVGSTQELKIILSAKGKQIIGWDEILEGGLSPNATVQSWRGFEGAQHAAEQGHDAIVSPTSHAYFDYPVSSIDVPKVYEFNLYPEKLDRFTYGHHIIGGECNLWSERIPDTETLIEDSCPEA